MHLYINFHRLLLTRGSSYTELPEWVNNKKVVINPQNKDEECFKWAVNEILHHEDIKDHPKRITLLKPYEKQYNWKGLKFPFMLYADFRSILKLVDERYRDKMNRMKVGRKGKVSYTEKINRHVP